MSETPQVDPSHYEFRSYMSKERWNSVWHQLDEVMRLAPANVLEIGPGPGVFGRVAALFGTRVDTLDLDRNLHPNCIGSATALPFSDDAYDVVCAFQMLEHLPYEQSMSAFHEMARVARNAIVISLPDASPASRLEFRIPKIGTFKGLIRRPFRRRHHEFDGQHYWEINKRGHSLKAVVADLSTVCRPVRSYRVYEHPFHRIFVFRI